MATTLQQQAKGLAAKKISNTGFDYNKEVDKYTTQNQNNANGRFDQLYDRQLNDSRITSQRSTQIQDRRRDEDYARQQVNIDADRLERANIRASQPVNTGGASFSESFGIGGVAPSGYHINYMGQKSLYNASEVADWRQRQDGVLNDMYGQEKRSSDLDRDKQAFLANTQAANQSRISQQQAALEAQRSAREQNFQSGQSDKDRANQRYLAELDSRTRMQQSIFNGNGNGFQYWGGSI